MDLAELINRQLTVWNILGVIGQMDIYNDLDEPECSETFINEYYFLEGNEMEKTALRLKIEISNILTHEFNAIIQLRNTSDSPLDRLLLKSRLNTVKRLAERILELPTHTVLVECENYEHATRHKDGGQEGGE